MKTIIAGDREIKDFKIVEAAIKESGFKITEVISGGADGVDSLGEDWAVLNGIPIKKFEAKWKDLKAKGAIIKENKFGKYNSRAGLDRNEKMAEYGEALIAVQSNGDSSGTQHMIKTAEKAGLQVFVYGKQEEKAEGDEQYLFYF